MCKKYTTTLTLMGFEVVERHLEMGQPKKRKNTCSIKFIAPFQVIWTRPDETEDDRPRLAGARAGGDVLLRAAVHLCTQEGTRKEELPGLK